MGLSFRKSIRLGKGVRLNLSKKGIGVSGGVKGLRLSTGPRGTVLSAGAGGLRFQKTLTRNANQKIKAVDNQINDEVLPDRHMFHVMRPLNSYFWVPMIISTLAAGIGAWFFWTCFVVAMAGFFYGSEKTRAWRKYDTAQEVQSFDEKVKLLSEAINKYPQKGIFFLRGFTYYSADRFEEAIKDFEQVIKLYSTPTLWSLLGHCYLRTKQHSQAIAVFEKVDEADEFDGFMGVLLLKAETFFEMKEFDRAEAIVKTALAKRKEEYAEIKRDFKVWSARISNAKGDTKKAIATLNALLKDVPEHEPAINFLAEMEAK